MSVHVEVYGGLIPLVDSFGQYYSFDVEREIKPMIDSSSESDQVFIFEPCCLAPNLGRP